MLIETTRFGSIDINQKDIINMPKGLFGFENFSKYFLVQQGINNVFAWIHATENPDLAFVVSNPFEFYQNYEFDIENEDVHDLDITSQEDIIVLSILTIPADPKDISANLVAPILINKKNNKGKQIILKNNKYNTKHYIMQDLQRLAEKMKLQHNNENKTAS